MSDNPALGVLIFMLGGLAGAVFYLPFKKVRNWAWESYWLVYAVVGLVLVPWILALCTSPNVLAVLQKAPLKDVGYCFLCGAMWGFGGLTWGLMIRYLGVGLGLALGAGLASAAGTLVPKALNREFDQLFVPGAGLTSFAGVVVSLAGIVIVGLAGMSKEKELPEEEKKKAVAEFNFPKGILVAIFSGLMSAGMGFGLQGGKASRRSGPDHRPSDLFHLAGYACPRRGPAGRFRRELPVVPVSELQEQDHRRLQPQRGPIDRQLPLCRSGWGPVVFTVYLFQDGRNCDGRYLLCRLGRADGLHDHVWHPSGHPAGRMEGDQQPNPKSPDRRLGAAVPVVGHCGLQRLSHPAQAGGTE